MKPAIAELVKTGELEPVSVDGWTAPAYLRAGQIVPRFDRGTALLCPFDPLIFFRPRVQRLFDFHYRIEIYTPAPKRQFGYYVWPFLLDGRLVGRVDLKAERASGRAERRRRVRRTRAGRVAGGRRRWRRELRSMASWLGLSDVTVGKRGDLAPQLRRQLNGMSLSPLDS